MTIILQKFQVPSPGTCVAASLCLSDSATAAMFGKGTVTKCPQSQFQVTIWEQMWIIKTTEDPKVFLIGWRTQCHEHSASHSSQPLSLCASGIRQGHHCSFVRLRIPYILPMVFPVENIMGLTTLQPPTRFVSAAFSTKICQMKVWMRKL